MSTPNDAATADPLDSLCAALEALAELQSRSANPFTVAWGRLHRAHAAYLRWYHSPSSLEAEPTTEMAYDPASLPARDVLDEVENALDQCVLVLDGDRVRQADNRSQIVASVARRALYRLRLALLAGSEVAAETLQKPIVPPSVGHLPNPADAIARAAAEVADSGVGPTGGVLPKLAALADNAPARVEVAAETLHVDADAVAVRVRVHAPESVNLLRVQLDAESDALTFHDRREVEGVHRYKRGTTNRTETIKVWGHRSVGLDALTSPALTSPLYGEASVFVPQRDDAMYLDDSPGG